MTQAPIQTLKFTAPFFPLSRLPAECSLASQPDTARSVCCIQNTATISASMIRASWLLPERQNSSIRHSIKTSSKLHDQLIRKQLRQSGTAQFRNDLSSFLADDVIDGAIDHGRPLELPPRPGVRYVAFADPSGGRHDHFTLAIGHVEKDQIIADVIRGVAAPFDPASVTTDYAALLGSYGIREVVSDAYASEWAASAWRDAGLKHTPSDLPKSALYLEGLPEFMRGTIRIPDHPRLVRELRLLERRTSRVGKDIVDHGRNGSDDYANSVFGMIRLAIAKPAGVMVGTYGYGGGAITWRNDAPRQRSWSRQPGISAVAGKPREQVVPIPFILHKS
jgi:hypothetical protein